MSLSDLNIVSVSDVFPSVEYKFEHFKELLSKLNKTEALIWCCGLNCMVSNPSAAKPIRNLETAVQAVFETNEIRALNKFANSRGGTENISVLFRGQLLELIRWVCIFCKDEPQTEDAFNSATVRRDFAVALVMASHVWYERIKDYDWTKDSQDLFDKRAENMASFRQLVSGFTRYKSPEIALGRGYRLFCNHFRPLYPDCDNKFKKFGKISLDEYYSCITLMIKSFILDDRQKVEEFIFRKGEYWGELHHKRKEMEKFENMSVQTVKHLQKSLWGNKSDASLDDAPKYTYTPIRNKPILETDDGRMIIIDPLFLLEKAEVGPLFTLSIETRGSGSREPFQTFGKAFESYACESLSTAFDTGSSILVSRLECRPKERDGKAPDEIIDALVNNFNTAVLFEMKSFLLKDEDMLNEDPGIYQESLLDRYEHGLEQLSTAIKNLESGEWVPEKEDQDFSNVSQVYPVLLVHDALFDTPTQTDFLAAKFKERLGEFDVRDDGFYSVGKFKVAPLNVMTIDLLERLENSLREFDFVSLLRDYHDASTERTIGILDFIGSSTKYKGKLFQNERLRQSYYTVLEITASFLKQGIPHKDIREKAYKIWKLKGCKHGDDLGDWFRAENEICGLLQ